LVGVRWTSPLAVVFAFGLAEGENDGRHSRPAAHAADHVDAVDPRKAEIEDDDIRVLPG
jgi:hypothetical protein